MANILPPPSTNVPLVRDHKDPGRVLTLDPVWRRWFLDLSDIINKSGGSGGAVATSRTINTTLPLTGGGDLSQNRTLEFIPAGITGDVQYNNAGALGSITGITVTITTAKLTVLGADGSMTFTRGVLTSQVQAT
jgi:hypothetical protein